MKPRSCEKMADRFPDQSENALTPLVDQKNSENTKKGTKVALNVFREYLKEKKVDDAKDKLANAFVLRIFYAEARLK